MNPENFIGNYHQVKIKNAIVSTCYCIPCSSYNKRSLFSRKTFTDWHSLYKHAAFSVSEDVCI